MKRNYSKTIKMKIDMARAVIEEGCLVLLTEPKGKRPLYEFFPNGSKSATSDLGLIKKGLKKYPKANIAAVLPEGLLVLDVDGPAGQQVMDDLLSDNDVFCETLVVKTARGKHYYFKSDDISNNLSLKELDVKVNGYVLLPPSMHPSGVKYKIIQGGWDSISELPTEVANELRNMSKKDDFAEASSSSPAKLTKGNRNNRLTSIAGMFRHQGFSSKQILQVLKVVNQETCKPQLSVSEVKSIANSISRYMTDVDEYLGRMDEVEAKELKFLWYPYIPKIGLTMIDGHPGIGKSFFTVALAASGSRGEDFFNNKLMRFKTLFLAAEDAPEYILRPRLEDANAKLSSVFFMQDDFLLDMSGIEILRKMVERSKAKLIVIDPIVAFMPVGIDMFRANDVRSFLKPLDRLSKELEVAIVVVRHLTKGRADGAITRGQGSMDFMAAVRSGLIISKDPENPKQVVLAHSKGNYVEKAISKAYLICGGLDGKHPKVVYVGDKDISADDLQASSENKSELQIAKLFLIERLRSGPVPAKTINKDAVNKGISKRTLERARKELGVQATGGPKSMLSITSPK